MKKKYKSSYDLFTTLKKISDLSQSLFSVNSNKNCTKPDLRIVTILIRIVRSLRRLVTIPNSVSSLNKNWPKPT